MDSQQKGYVRIYLPDGSLKGYLAPEGTISREPVPFQKNIYCFMEDADGIIWMGSKLDGLFQMEKSVMTASGYGNLLTSQTTRTV